MTQWDAVSGKKKKIILLNTRCRKPLDILPQTSLWEQLQTLRLWKRRHSGLTFVIGASIVIEWILAMEEYRRVCKPGAAVRDSTVYMPQSGNQMTAFKECRMLSLGNSTTESSLIPYFSCVSPPASSCFTASFLALFTSSFAATPHFCCQFFCPSFTSAILKWSYT